MSSSTHDVRQWLDSLGLVQYADSFDENAVEWDQLDELTNDFLKDLGVTATGHRMRILKAVRELDPVHGAAAGPVEAAGAPTVTEAERRQLTVMFADMVGSTELSRALDPEDLRDINRAFQDAAKTAFESNGGYVARYMGDGVLAYFGYPHAHEDDAERAVRAGLALAEAMSANMSLKTVSARIGIATGPVVVGDLIGEGASQESAVVGETPNLAARIQSLAQPGTVVVAPATWRLTRSAFEYADLGERRVKGFDTPIQLRHAVRERAAGTRFESAATDLAPMVGRVAELAILEDRWTQAMDGQGKVILLGGEAGVGKSRLVQRFQQALGQQPKSRVLYFCSAHHQHSALYPISEQLRRVLDLEPGASETITHERLLETLQPLGIDTSAVVPPLVDLLAPESRDAVSLVLDARQRKERVLHAMVSVYERMALRAPLLLIVEDAHWADPSTMELLELAMEQLRRSRVVMLFTARPGFEPDWRHRSHVTTLSLSALGHRDSVALIRQTLGERQLPAVVLDQIAERSQGVPLFAEELAKTLADADPAAGPTVSTSRELETVIPASLHDSLMARLDRLGPAKALAQLASTLGQTFNHALLAALWPHGADRLEQAIGTMLEADLLQRRGRPPQFVYVFKHALLRETAYQAVLKSTRRRHHRQIAQALIHQFPAIAQSEPETVAHHFTEAGLAEQAVDYWCRAGDRAWARFAALEAVAHFDRGLEQIPALGATPEVAQKELAARVTLGGALCAAMGFANPRVEQNYLRAHELCETAGSIAQRFAVTWGLWLFAQYSGQMARAKQLAESVLTLSAGREESEYRLQAHHATWTTAIRVGRFEACLRHAEAGLAMYSPQEHNHHVAVYGGHDPGVCACYNSAVALWARGCPDQALTRALEGQHLADQLPAPYDRGAARSFVCIINQLRGDAQRCLDVTEKWAATVDLGEHLHQAAVATAMRGWALATLGEQTSGIGLLTDGIEAYQRTGARVRLAYLLTLLAERHLHAGSVQEGLGAARAAQELVESSGEMTFASETYRVFGEVLSASNRNEETAEEWLLQAVSIAREQGAPGFELRACTSLARLWHVRGEQQRAYEMLAPVYARFGEGFGTRDLDEAQALLSALS
jgi:class 3 adenylate cyclase/tetratricopeptide (TPR) repeat protein